MKAGLVRTKVRGRFKLDAQGDRFKLDAQRGKYTRRRESSSIHSVLHFIVHPILQFDSFLFFNSIRSFYFFVFFYASGRTTDALLSTKRRVATVCHSFPFDGAYHNPWAWC